MLKYSWKDYEDEEGDQDDVDDAGDEADAREAVPPPSTWASRPPASSGEAFPQALELG
jgi:hypothetical protein